MIEVRAVSGKRELRRFIGLPYRQYRGDRCFVPPLRMVERERLNPRKNPFYDHADLQPFLAWDGSAIRGRIAAIDDRLHNEVHAENVAAFGFFEADSPEVAAALLRAVEQWSGERGRSAIRGPVSPSLHDVAGLLVDGFDDPPFILMPYNPPVYAAFIEGAGYRKVKDLFAWIFDGDLRVPKRLAAAAARCVERNGITMRSLDRSRLAEEIIAFRTIYARAWEDNWGFVPPTEREFEYLAHSLEQVADDRLALCAEVRGEVVGFAVALPDINQVLPGTGGRLLPLGLYRLLTRRRRIDQVRLALLGVLPEARSLGIYPVLLAELFRRREGTPYRRAEASWVLEDNDDINRTAAQFGGVRYKTYRIYEKPCP